MKESSTVETVMSNPILISKIVSFLRYDYMKTCRLVNKIWRYEVTKLTRPRTRVCVNEDNIDSMLYASTILGLTLHIRWSSLISLGLRTLVQKYARYIESLSWFVDGSGVLRGQKTGCIVAWNLDDLIFPRVTELYLILTECEGGQAYNFQLISALLRESPKLEKLRLEVFDVHLNFSRVLRHIKQINFQQLVSLHVGKGVQLCVNDFKVIKALTPKLESFTWEAPIILETWAYQSIFRGSWIESLCSLELNSPPPCSLPMMPNLRRLSLSSVALTNYNIRMIDQFPRLEDLRFSLKSGCDWSTWIPHDMPLHREIKSLTWTSRRELCEDDRNCLTRLIRKLPNLKSLTCPADDEFIQVICQRLPHLETLKLHGNKLSDSGVIGISEMEISEIIMTFGRRAVKMSTIDKYRTKPCICNLKELVDLTLMHTAITDLSIPLAISGMKKLRKLYLTGISMVGILELLTHPTVLELGVPQPIEKTISFEDIVLLQTTTPHIKIVSGWDAPYIRACSK